MRRTKNQLRAAQLLQALQLLSTVDQNCLNTTSMALRLNRRRKVGNKIAKQKLNMKEDEGSCGGGSVGGGGDAVPGKDGGGKGGGAGPAPPPTAPPGLNGPAAGAGPEAGSKGQLAVGAPGPAGAGAPLGPLDHGSAAERKAGPKWQAVVGAPGPAGAGAPLGPLDGSAAGPKAGSMVQVMVANVPRPTNFEGGMRESEVWTMPASIANEPLQIGTQNGVISEQYLKKGFAFLLPEALPFGLVRGGRSENAKLVTALTAEALAEKAKSSEWEQYILREIVEKGGLGSDRVRSQMPNTATQIWNRMFHSSKVRYWVGPPNFALPERDDVCKREERGGQEGFKTATVLTEARARSAKKTTPSQAQKSDVREKVLEFLHSDVTLYGMPDVWQLLILPNLSTTRLDNLPPWFAVNYREWMELMKRGGLADATYGGVYPALGYYWQLMTTLIPVEGESTIVERLFKNPEVKSLAKDVCQLLDSDIKTLVDTRYWGFTLETAIGRAKGATAQLTAEQLRDNVYILGYMIALGIVADPKKACGDKDYSECKRLPSTIALETYKPYLQSGRIPNLEVAELPADVLYALATDLGDAFTGLAMEAGSTVQKWGCFWARLRVADSFNVWMNLTPPEGADQVADPTFLRKPHPIKNPLAVIDPFSIKDFQTGEWSQRTIVGPSQWPSHPHARDISKMQVRPWMYYGEALYFNTHSVMHTAMMDTNQDSLQFRDTIRSSIESRVVVLDICLKKAPLTGPGDVENTENLVKTVRKVCYGGGEARVR